MEREIPVPADAAPAPPTTAATARLPASPAVLGYGGLIPFVALAAGAALGGAHADFLRAGLFAYGAVILAFVGALHWGYAVAAPGLSTAQRASLYRWSVVPALLAWPALLLYARPAAALLIGGLALQYWRDRRLCAATGGALLPPWYLRLRLHLTLVACASIAVGGLWGG